MSDRPSQEAEPRVVVRDKRRIDPESGQVREPATGGADAELDPTGPDGAATPASGSGPAAGSADSARVAELTETLQRLKAEYDNYRRRADRERTSLIELATGSVLTALLPVLDDVERARTHGDLTGAFGAVGESLIAVTAKLGLEPYAAKGDEFDPQIHEAVMQAPPADESDVAVVAEVFRPGYRHAGRVLRAAQVSVSEPGSSVAQAVTAPEDENEETKPSA